MSAVALDCIPSVTVAGVTVEHNSQPWRVATNRHPTLYGRSWGWIEGAPGHVCWSNDEKFNEAAAVSMVAAHAKWLEDQKPLSIKLVESSERYRKAEKQYQEAAKAYEAAKEKFRAAGDELAGLRLQESGPTP